MKRIISITLAVMMICALCTSAFAATISEDQSHISSTTVQYGMDISYLVTIPDKVALNADKIGSATISIANAILPSGAQLDVSILGDSYVDGVWHLSNTAVNSEKLGYTIEGADNQYMYASGDVVLTVKAGEVAATTKNRVLNFALVDDVTKSGQYADTLTFTIEMLETPINTSSLIGSYSMLSVRPTPANAIVPDIAALGITPYNILEPETAAMLFQVYGVLIESNVQLPVNVKDYAGTPGDLIVHANILGITPWMVTELEGEIYYAVVVYGHVDKTTDESSVNELPWMLYWHEDDVVAAMDELASTTPTVDFVISSEPATTEAVRTAFLKTHARATEEVQTTMSFMAYDGQRTTTYDAPRNATWSEYIASAANTQFAAYKNWVVVKDTQDPVLLNGRPVFTTDAIRTTTYDCMPAKTELDGIYCASPVAPNASNTITVPLTEEDMYLFQTDVDAFFEKFWVQYNTTVIIEGGDFLDEVRVTPWLRFELGEQVAHVFLCGFDESSGDNYEDDFLAIPYDYTSEPLQYDMQCAQLGLMYLYGHFQNTESMSPEYQAVLANTFTKVANSNVTMAGCDIKVEGSDYAHVQFPVGYSWVRYMESVFYDKFVVKNDAWYGNEASLHLIDGYVYLTLNNQTRVVRNYDGSLVRGSDIIRTDLHYFTCAEEPIPFKIGEYTFIASEGMTWYQYDYSVYQYCNKDAKIEVYYSTVYNDVYVNAKGKEYYLCDANGNHITEDQIIDFTAEYTLLPTDD